MRRPNILFMNRVYPPVRGATGRVLQDLALAFSKEGWHVTIITSGPQKGQERDGNIRIVRVKGAERPRNIFSYLWVWIKMVVMALRLKKRHVLVTLSDPPLMVVGGQIVTKIKGGRHINWCHDLYPDVMPALGYKVPDFLMAILKKFSRRSMESCDKIIVSGRCMAKHLAYDGISARKIAMIPNWPNLELVDPERLDDDHPHAFHVPAGGVRPHEDQIKDKQRFRVLYAGNIGLAHTLDTILDAAEILEREKSDIEFVFVGDGARFDFIAAQRSKRHLENIRLLPHQPLSRLREMLESGDVHLISMKDDAAGFIVPSKLYASLAVARPSILVGPEQSEVAKVIHDFKSGGVVANGDAQGLVDLIKLYRTDGQAWFAAHKGAAHARDVFTPAESLSAWMERAWSVVEDDIKAESCV